MTIKPTLSLRPFPGKESRGVCVHLFGRHNPIPTEDSPEGLAPIAELLFRKHNLLQLYRPNTSPPFDGNIIEGGPGDFPNKFVAGRVHVHHGAKAEGVLLDPGTAAGIRVADCAACVAYDPKTKKMVVFRAGLQSLIRRARGQASVAKNAIATLTGRGADINDIWVGIFLAIRGRHLVYGPEDQRYPGNSALLKTIEKIWDARCLSKSVPGGIRLKHVIRAELRRLGVINAQIVIGDHSPFDDVDTDGQPLWYSHRREGKNRMGANFVLIVNPPKRRRPRSGR